MLCVYYRLRDALHYTEDLVFDMRSLLICLISNTGNLLLRLISNIRDLSLNLGLDLSPRRLYLVQSSLGDLFGLLLHFFTVLAEACHATWGDVSCHNCPSTRQVREGIYPRGSATWTLVDSQASSALTGSQFASRKQTSGTSSPKFQCTFCFDRIGA
ncbi:uncharacterized protein C8R40DRAFT_1110203 [Lentinula edodes]|uniref:uncharacterized protein n=1 Tax=Lentinula edodes TaxID=5353 RepID=UPI001E8E5DDA|nr:uncharacterized protein C8R40DRAFT_1110203 [Lentinula edodes]KAH7874257.1 hypothetical protein C8R40DRAFT_1110203 [Lentinula edodes]